MLTPKQSSRKRYELEQWVTSQRNGDEPGLERRREEGEASLSQTQVRQMCSQVSQIVQAVNRKADEIREQLYQRSQDHQVRKMQIEGYSEMHMYKKALGIQTTSKGASAAGAAPTLAENIEVIDQSDLREEEEQADDEEPSQAQAPVATDLTEQN